MKSSRVEKGQATVELAFALILLSVVMMLLLQVGLVARDQILVVHAAREGVRVAAVDSDEGSAAEAAKRSTGLNANRLSIKSNRDGSGDYVTVDVAYRSRIGLAGRSLLEPTLSASATMKVESGGL